MDKMIYTCSRYRSPVLACLFFICCFACAGLCCAQEVVSDEMLYEVLDSVRKKEELEIVESVLKRIITKQAQGESEPVFVEQGKVKNFSRIRIEGLINDDLSKDIIIPLMECRDTVFDVTVLCNPEWRVREEENALFLSIDSNPAVTMTITRIQKDFRFLYQLNNEDLKTIGIYGDNFATEEVQLSGRPAIKVKAYSRQFPDMRISDYYLVHEGVLYGLLFSVDPKEEWENYKFLIEKIANAFYFDKALPTSDNPAL